jgi:hypothetical protein
MEAKEPDMIGVFPNLAGGKGWGPDLYCHGRCKMHAVPAGPTEASQLRVEFLSTHAALLYSTMVRHSNHSWRARSVVSRRLFGTLF